MVRRGPSRSSNPQTPDWGLSLGLSLRKPQTARTYRPPGPRPIASFLLPDKSSPPPREEGDRSGASAGLVRRGPSRPSNPQTPDWGLSAGLSLRKRRTMGTERPPRATIASARLAETNSPPPRGGGDRNGATGGVVRHRPGRPSKPRTGNRRAFDRSVPSENHKPQAPTALHGPPSHCPF